MNSVIDDIGQHLANNGFGSLGAEIFLSFLPDSPDSCVALIETSGTAPEYTHDRALPWKDNPSFKVIARDRHPQLAKKRADAIWAFLASVNDLTLNGVRYFTVAPKHNPYSLGKDQNDRHEYHCDFQVERQI
ncbi:MAG TPA: minor capsid protein [Candidatus Acidoferrales bacterium]|nr:minor capsid protein [Candidatus Acidoferrales bacterium]